MKKTKGLFLPVMLAFLLVAGTAMAESQGRPAIFNKARSGGQGGPISFSGGPLSGGPDFDRTPFSERQERRKEALRQVLDEEARARSIETRKLVDSLNAETMERMRQTGMVNSGVARNYVYDSSRKRTDTSQKNTIITTPPAAQKDTGSEPFSVFKFNRKK